MTRLRSGVLAIAWWLAASAAQAEPPDFSSGSIVVAQAGVTGDPSAAPHTDSQSDVLFITLDKNHDGYLSEKEASSEVADFDTADANGDGRVDPTEFEAARNVQPGPEGAEVEPDQAAS